MFAASPQKTATLIGLSAVAIWSTLALATSATGAMPPFLLNVLTFTVAGLFGVAAVIVRGTGFAVFRQPWPVWVHGVGGLFGFHFFYFTALKLAPPAEASLIAYLWPLLIVVFSAFLPGERLRAVHVMGALMGLAGTVILLGGRAGGFDFSPTYLLGYLSAAACAVVWAVYSVASRRFASVPTEVVAGFCLATAVLSVPFHLALEPSVWPSTMSEWLAVLGLGIGPVGIAFYTWDVGMKRGDIRLLGVAAYAAPVLSTMLLVVAGFAQPSWSLAAACALIVGGAAVATLLARR